VYEDYKSLLSKTTPVGRTLLYIDPPYYNPNKGSFTDENGYKRTHKQAPSYEGHLPQAYETWLMFEECVQFGLNAKADMILCNYNSEPFEQLLKSLETDLGYSLEPIVKDKICDCTGQKSKYATLPVGKESVFLARYKE
jgi:hypothetical protein